MRKGITRLAAVGTTLVLAAAGCTTGSQTLVTPTEQAPLLGLDPVVPTPIDNPPTPAKLTLGERLFFDPLLSLDGTRSCASCHRPEESFSDVSAVSLGIRDQPTLRNAPPLINRAWGQSFFRDGRAPSLEAAVLQPVLNPRELGLTIPILEARLEASPEYRGLFGEAFAEEPGRSTSEAAAAALATFIRSLRSGDAAVDRYRSGDSTALTPLQREGRGLFLGKARCASCHIGPTFSDEGFHNTGVAVRSGDPGRQAVTSATQHRGAFRTPTLRDVALTAPYMHDGSLRALEDVIDFYDRGGVPNPNLDFQIRPIGLTDGEKEALIAFLQGLTGAP